jgi:hypothetical protein
MIWILLAFATGCGSPEPMTFVVPTDYEGWVVVELAIPGLDPAPLEAGVRVMRIDASGRAKTGSPLRAGKLRYADAGGRSLSVLEDNGVGYDAAHAVTRAAPFACCRTNGTTQAEDAPERTFERFYVGRGPAGEPPALPGTP